MGSRMSRANSMVARPGGVWTGDETRAGAETAHPGARACFRDRYRLREQLRRVGERMPGRARVVELSRPSNAWLGGSQHGVPLIV